MARTLRIVRFWTQFIPPKGTAPARAIDWVEYTHVGKAHMQSVVAEIDRLKKVYPREGAGENIAILMANDRWDQIRPQYEAWKAGRELPLSGTPLAAWPGVSSDQAEALRLDGLRTVEELAELGDAAMARLRVPGGRELRIAAKAFLEAADRNKVSGELAELRQQLEARNAEDADQRATIKAMAEELAALREERAAVSRDTAAVKRGPGRPKKITADDIADDDGIAA